MDVTLQDIFAARKRIAPVARRTPLELSPWLSERAGHEVYLKLECWQRTRSFKMRGAYNAIASLSAETLSRGLVTASAGNHGQAVALSARFVGAQATIFLPHNAPQTKKDRIRSFGAVMRDELPTYDDAEVAAVEFAREKQAHFVHAFADAQVVAGQGTIGLEILEELPEVTTVIVPVGGGGLIAAIGVALKSSHQDIRLIGVQSSRTTAMYDAFQAGGIVESPIPPTIADGLAGCTDQISYERAREVIDQMLLVDEEALPAAITGLFRMDGVVAEGAGAVGVASILEQVVSLTGPTAVVISGGNIDATLLARLLSEAS